jgi:hypothetical protein
MENMRKENNWISGVPWRTRMELVGYMEKSCEFCAEFSLQKKKILQLETLFDIEKFPSGGGGGAHAL